MAQKGIRLPSAMRSLSAVRVSAALLILSLASGAKASPFAEATPPEAKALFAKIVESLGGFLGSDDDRLAKVLEKARAARP